MTHTIGEKYGGGIIFYIDETGDHGLVCSQDYWIGNWFSAIKLLADLDLEGYRDWYLPSIFELNLIYEQRVAIGGYTRDGYYYYWSATENLHNEKFAWLQNFGDGKRYIYVDINGKASEARFCVVRAF